MKLATIRTEAGTRAARLEDNTYTLIGKYQDVGELLSEQNWQDLAAQASGETLPAAEAEVAQLINRPGKVVCVGLNYRGHILEMGRDLPSHPTLFAKYAETLTGPYDDIVYTPEDPELDWEGELVTVIGKTVRRASEEEADQAIAGYTIADDISMRGWQFRTKEWLQGKIWEASTPLGPVLSTPDEVDLSSAELVTRVNGKVMQQHSTGDLLFTPSFLVSYISTMLPLNPGDVVLTGTPGGVGRARDPQVYLKPGDTVTVSIDGIGEIRNSIVEAV